MSDWLYDNNKRKLSRMLTPDVKRYTREGVMQHAEILWKQFVEPNTVKPKATDAERMRMKRQYMDSVLEDFTRLHNLTDEEFVTFMRMRRENMNLTIEQFRDTPEIKKQIERVNAELRLKANERSKG
jgi:hypothetical protein